MGYVCQYADDTSVVTVDDRSCSRTWSEADIPMMWTNRAVSKYGKDQSLLLIPPFNISQS